MVAPRGSHFLKPVTSFHKTLRWCAQSKEIIPSSTFFLMKVLYHLVPFSGTVSSHMGDRSSHESGVRKISSSEMLHRY
jgi:hypothetical protein